ncbi:MAG: DUF4136 domain-containing protein [Flavobacteriales bacterium]
MNDLDKRRIVRVIKTNLEMKGLKKTNANPGLYLNILSYILVDAQKNILVWRGKCGGIDLDDLEGKD